MKLDDLLFVVFEAVQIADTPDLRDSRIPRYARLFALAGSLGKISGNLLIGACAVDRMVAQPLTPPFFSDAALYVGGGLFASGIVFYNGVYKNVKRRYLTRARDSSDAQE